MRAVAHGWKPSRIKGPTREVAKEFVSADKRRDNVTGYQFGGGVPYRGVPPQRGMIQRGPTAMAGRMRGPMPGRGGYGRAGGVPGTIGGFGGYQGGGGGGGALRQMMQRMQQQRGGLHPGAQGPGGGFLSRFAQQTPGQPLHPGAQGPGGGQRTYGGRPTPGLHDRQDMLMGEGPGGRLEQEGLRRQAKMRAGPRQFPGAGRPGGGALSQASGKPRPGIPGRRIAPPPGKYPGGGNPNLGGRNPMLRGTGRFGGRGGRGGRRGMLR